jgi:hypothetical protein
MMAEMMNPLLSHLDETVRLLASKDALAYSELSYVKQRESQIDSYGNATRYYTGDALAAEEAKLAGDFSDEIEIDKEDLDAITSVLR